MYFAADTQKAYLNNQERQGMKVRNIVLDTQSGLYARAIRRILLQDLDDYQVVISEAPDRTAECCRIFRPYALLMEVTGNVPWILKERLVIQKKVKKQTPECKIVLLVDDVADRGLAEQVKQAKKEGNIDGFIFSSVTESYLVSYLDSL